MGAEAYIKADRDGWKRRCAIAEEQLAAVTNRAEKAEAAMVAVEHEFWAEGVSQTDVLRGIREVLTKYFNDSDSVRGGS